MTTPPLAGLTGIARRLVADGALAETDARKAAEMHSGRRFRSPRGWWRTASHRGAR